MKKIFIALAVLSMLIPFSRAGAAESSSTSTVTTAGISRTEKTIYDSHVSGQHIRIILELHALKDAACDSTVYKMKKGFAPMGIRSLQIMVNNHVIPVPASVYADICEPGSMTVHESQGQFALDITHFEYVTTLVFDKEKIISTRDSHRNYIDIRVPTGTLRYEERIQGQNIRVLIETYALTDDENKEINSSLFEGSAPGHAFTRVRSLQLFVNNHPILVPHSLFSGRLDPHYVSVFWQQGTFVLSLMGLDAAESYELRAFFDTTKVIRSQEFSECFPAPDSPASETKYVYSAKRPVTLLKETTRTATTGGCDD